MGKLINNKNFENQWRFDNSNYTLLPPSDSDAIKPINPDVSVNTWERIVGTQISHLTILVSNDQWTWEPVLSTIVDTDNYEAGKDFLNSLEISDNTNILFFWSKKDAVETTWSTFIRYWNDFCYPSDDNNVMYIQESETLLTFVEEHFQVYSKKEVTVIY